MFNRKHGRQLWIISLTLLLSLILSACNLGAAPEAEATLTLLAETGTQDVNVTRTAQPQGGVTVFPTLTPFVFSTRPVVVPTTIVLVPNQPVYPTATSAPINILIVSPLSGNVVSGSVNVFGSASHPNFLQYRLEFGPEPNPNNLWFALTGVVQQQVYSGVLGVWPTNTGATPDGYYQLRLRVFLRDGTQLTTQVGGIRVQNNRPTPVPTNTTVASRIIGLPLSQQIPQSPRQLRPLPRIIQLAQPHLLCVLQTVHKGKSTATPGALGMAVAATAATQPIPSDAAGHIL
jgi:hypothetical protein